MLPRLPASTGLLALTEVLGELQERAGRKARCRLAALQRMELSIRPEAGAIAAVDDADRRAILAGQNLVEPKPFVGSFVKEGEVRPLRTCPGAQRYARGEVRSGAALTHQFLQSY